MNNRRMRGLFLAAIVGALSAPFASAGFTLEWDPAPPEFGACDYTVEKANENDSPISWTAVATTSAPVMGFSSNPAPGDMYRLRIRSTISGLSTLDPNVVKPHPPTNLNFRMKDTFDENASVEAEDNGTRLADNESTSGDPGAMLAAFQAAISAPDPETPSFDLFEAFLQLQADGETPFLIPPPENPGDLVALVTPS